MPNPSAAQMQNLMPLRGRASAHDFLVAKRRDAPRLSGPCPRWPGKSPLAAQGHCRSTALPWRQGRVPTGPCSILHFPGRSRTTRPAARRRLGRRPAVRSAGSARPSCDRRYMAPAMVVALCGAACGLGRAAGRGTQRWHIGPGRRSRPLPRLGRAAPGPAQLERAQAALPPDAPAADGGVGDRTPGRRPGRGRRGRARHGAARGGGRPRGRRRAAGPARGRPQRPWQRPAARQPGDALASYTAAAELADQAGLPCLRVRHWSMRRGPRR